MCIVHPRLVALMHLRTAVILLRRAYIAWEKNTTIGILIACVFLVCYGVCSGTCSPREELTRNNQASLGESAYSMHDFFSGVRSEFIVIAMLWIM